MRYSVDAIAKYFPNTESQDDESDDWGNYVVIRRLSFPFGLAFPGGGIEGEEDKNQAVVREFKEETNLDFYHTSSDWLPKVYDEEGRDPRGPATSFVSYGIARGVATGEKNKTEVLFLSKEEILAREKEFVFDHFQMFLDYLAR